MRPENYITLDQPVKLLTSSMASGIQHKHLILKGGLQDRLGRCIHIQRLTCQPQMFFHRGGGQAHQHGNVLRRLAITDPFQHLALAFGQVPHAGIGQGQDFQMRDIVHDDDGITVVAPDVVPEISKAPEPLKVTSDELAMVPEPKSANLAVPLIVVVPA